MSIDLHIHSTFSDGSMTPAELVRLARQSRLSAIAVTDHDTTDGIEEAMEAGRALGVTVISGVELSVKLGDINLHLLGYLFDSRQQDFLQALQRVQEGRLVRNGLILEALRRQGVSIQPSELMEVAGPGQCGRPHIAQLMIAKGAVKTLDEAFERYLGQGGSAYVPRFIYSAGDAIALIHRAGGLAVLAHPQLLEKTGQNFPGVIAELHRLGLDGVEVYYPSHSRQFRKMLQRLTEKHGLLKTGGSDYHGAIRPGTTLAGGKGCFVSDQLLVEMLARLAAERNIQATEPTIQ
jgi:predicted metal-dependent phosphoesterase TrpH